MRKFYLGQHALVLTPPMMFRPGLGVVGRHAVKDADDFLTDSIRFRGYCAHKSVSVSGYHRAVPSADRTMTDFFKYRHAALELKSTELDAVRLGFDMLECRYKKLKNRATTEHSVAAVVAELRPSSSSSVEGRPDGPTRAHLITSWVGEKTGNVLDNCWRWYVSGCSRARLHEVCAKCEVRPDSKLNKTRAFVNMSIYSYVASCALWRDTNKLLTGYARLRSCVPDQLRGAYVCGVASQRRGFHSLLARMFSRPARFYFDAKHWDGSMLAAYMELVALFRWRLLAPSERTLKSWCTICNLTSDDCFSVLRCPDGTIRVKNGGQPSGRFTTLSDNTLIGEALYYAAWCLLEERDGSHSADERLDSFDLTFDLAVFGDDSILAGSGPHSSADWIAAFARLNIEMEAGQTPEFLSHDIVLVDGVYQLQPRGSKLIGKLAFGRRIVRPDFLSDIQYEYLRACGVCNESYLDQSTYAFLCGYLDYLEETELNGVPFRSTIQFGEIASARMRPEELSDLWS